jgi:hypothetical protein
VSGRLPQDVLDLLLAFGPSVMLGVRCGHDLLQRSVGMLELQYRARLLIKWGIMGLPLAVVLAVTAGWLQLFSP